MINGLMSQEDITVPNVYTLKSMLLTYMMQKLIELLKKRESTLSCLGTLPCFSQ